MKRTTNAKADQAVQTQAGRKKRRALMTSTALAAAGLVLLSANPAKALPQGEDVVGGTVTYDRSVPGTLTGNQVTDRAYTLWDTFDTAAGESVILNLPSSSALSVNKVTGLVDIDGTQFDGLLSSNGNVWILDANGVFFGASARVDVGGILASTGDVGVADVMDGDGRFEFSNFGDGQIVNFGTMNVSDAGLAAFVAPYAANSGVINAKLGTVAFAAGEKVTLDMYGDGLYEIAVDGELADALLENTESGKINAEGGTVHMAASAAKSAVDNIINLDGVTTVASATVKGGKIILSGGGKGVVKVSGIADASGSTGGGSVDVRGQSVEVNGAILADATKRGNGGTVDMIGVDKAVLNGYVSARGGAKGGNGGAVELSAAGAVGLGDQALVNTTAAKGDWGSFLIDPAFMTLYNGPNNLPGFINADTVGLILYFTNFALGATDTFNIQGDVDISEADFDYEKKVLGVTVFEYHLHDIAGGDLTILAPTVNMDGNLTIGQGNLSILADTFNLDGKVLQRGAYHGPVTTVTDEARLGGLISTINVGSSDALIKQAINFMADIGTGKTINVAAGNYNEPVYLNKKNVALIGAPGATINVGSTQTGVVADANGTEVSGFTINGGRYGIQANNVDGFAAHNNILNGQVLAAMNFTGTTKNVAPLTGNVFDGAASYYIHNKAADAVVDASDNTYNGLPHPGYNPANDPLDLQNLFALEDRTLHKMDNDVYGIVYYVPDALFVTENTAGIQRAVDISKAGHSIYVQAGTYSESVNVDKRLSLYGANAGIDPNTGLRNPETIVAPSSPGFHVTAGGSLIDGFMVIGASDGVFVDNVNFVGVANNIFVDSSANGVRILNGLGNSVVNNRIDGFDLAGVNVFGSTLTNVIGNVMFNGGSDGIRIRNAMGANISGNDIADVTDTGINVINSDSLTIENNTIGDADDDGIRVVDSGDITVSGNTIEVAETGIDVLRGTDVTLSGNVMNGHDDEIAVKVTDSSAVDVSGNTIDDYETGVSILDSSDVGVSGNTITSVDYGVIANNVSGLEVANNIMSGNSITGIWVLNSDGAQVDENEINDFEIGVKIENSDNVEVTDNTIDGSSLDGIYAENSGMLRIAGNQITNTGWDGINIQHSSDVEIEGNIIDGTVNNEGIGADYVTGSLLIKDNNISNTGDNGVEVVFSENVTITGNTVENTGWHGLNLHNNTGLVVGGFGEGEGNVIDGTVQNGINVVDSAGAQISKNQIANTAGHGIFVDPSDSSVISGNTVLNAALNGIYSAGNSNVTIGGATAADGNTVTDAGLDGILVEGGGGNIVQNNVVSGSGDDGVHVNNAGTATVSANQISGSGNNGVEVIGNTGVVTVSSNAIDGSGWDGVNVQLGSGFVNVLDNAITNTLGASGVAFINHSGDGLIDGNSIDNSGRLGVYVGYADGLTISNNVITNSGLEFNVNGSRWAGIHIEGADNTTIDSNTVNIASGDGINIGSPINGGPVSSTGNIVTGNIVNNTGDNGVEVTDSYGVQITGNQIGLLGGVGNIGDEGIDVNNSALAQITGNTVFNTVSNGISINPSPDSLIAGNTVSHFGGNAFGIYVLNSDNTVVDDNDISFGGTGIRIEGSENVDVTDNDMHDLDIDGIHVLSGSHGALVQGNEILDTAQVAGSEAIRIDDSDNVDLLGNTTNKSWVGVAAYNSDNLTVDGNHGTLVRTGVLLDNVHTATINANIMRVNAMNVANTVGVDLKNSSDIDITANNLDDFIAGIRVVDSNAVDVDGNVVTDANYGVLADTVGALTVTNNSLDGRTGAGKGTAGIHVTDSAGAKIGLAGNGNAVSDFNAGIRIENGADTLVEDNDISEFTAFGIRMLGSADSVVNINTINNAGAAGVGISVENGNGTAITGNDLDNMAGNGIQLITSHDATILSNTLDNIGGNGIWTNASDRAEVAYNLLGGITLDGVLVDAGVDADIHENTLSGIGGNGVDVNGNEGVNVEANTISGVTGNGIDVSLSNNAKIASNDLDDIAGNGIKLTDSHYAAILSNTLGNIGGNGIWVDPSDDADVGYNVITGVALDGILVDGGASASIHHNSISDVDGDGIDVNGNQLVVINDNDIWDVAGNGIDVAFSDGATIFGNDLDDVSGTGIRLTEGNDAWIHTNTLDNIGGNGIWVDLADYAQIAGNVLNGIGLHGILAGAGTNANIADNTVGDVDGDGIHVENNADSDIGGNVVYDVEGNGIDVAFSNGATIAGNDLDDIDGNGVKLTDSHDVRIENNTLDNIGGNGIWVDPSDNTDVAYNTLSGIGLDGILVDGGAGASIFENTVMNADGNGIAVNGHQGVDIRLNTVSGAGANGIRIVDSADAYVHANNIQNSDLNGIYAHGTENILIEENTVGNAGEDGIHAEHIHAGEGYEGGHLARIVGNDVSSVGGDGIEVYAVDDSLVDGNDVLEADEDGIKVTNFVENDPTVVSNNIVRHVGDNGIEVTGIEDVTVDHNFVNHVGNTGIYLTHFLDSEITGNAVANTGNDGIFADGYNDEGMGNSIYIARNLVVNTGEDGIQSGYTDDVTIDGNVVLNAGNTGIDAYNAGYVDIGNNLTFRTGFHGIRVADSGYAAIAGNQVYQAGYGSGTENQVYQAGYGSGAENEDGYTADGIHVQNVYGYNGGSGEWVEGEGPFVVVTGNTVRTTADDGIEVVDSGDTLVSYNDVSRAGTYLGPVLTGFDEEPSIYVYEGDSDDNGADGIAIRNIGGSVNVLSNTVYDNADDGVDIEDAPHVEVIGNEIFGNGDDGLVVRDVYNYDTLIVTGNDIDGNYGDGVDAANVYGGAFFTDNTVTNNGGDGIKVRYIDHVEIADNAISGNGDDGIDADWINTPTTLIIDGNTVNDNEDNGIEVSNSLTTEILNNLIYNNGAHGLFMQGGNNQFVTLAGNVFTDNPVHARFESGLIDLTGEGNVFNFGDIALQFSPAPLYEYEFKGEGDFMISFEGPESIGYAPMALVGDTIGSQFFNGQSTYFAELSNGAFFNPGTPTVLDATDSTFVTPFGVVNPSATGDFISADVHAFLESMFFHFNDNNTLGLFFYGNILNPEIDQEDIFRTFAAFGPAGGNVNFTLNGMPFVDPALALAAIAPAAGNGEKKDGQKTPQNLASIEPAAGGDSVPAENDNGDGTVHCWGDAVTAAAGGASVSYSFGSGLDQAVADAAACRSGQQPGAGI